MNQQSQTPSSPLRILLVEDSEHDQLAFRRAFDKSNIAFELTICRRGEDVPGRPCGPATTPSMSWC